MKFFHNTQDFANHSREFFSKLRHHLQAGDVLLASPPRNLEYNP